MDRIKDAVIDPLRACTTDTWPEELLPEPVGAAILALEHGVDDILPSIFYEMHMCYVASDWDKLAETMVAFNANERGARWDIATKKILFLRDIVREEGERWLISRVPNLFGGVRHTSKECPNSIFSVSPNDRASVHLTTKEAMYLSRDWLKTLRQSTIQARCTNLKLCSSCMSSLSANISTLRKDFWTFLIEVTNKPRA